ncbi:MULTISPECIES: HD-GYP domain-containing protein [Oceanibaculum]|uniref:HD domain-containing protein n=1 Tax=Oceanibaculum indicum TaxID=526216 RepID=A0A420WR38_9PROT|nr:MULTISPECIES: HD-GYP domain-containing protein [Oceanibaculum]MCH2396578.1 HD-GYP domain-containing protein [Oceanibaculum sp.]RKQ73326.1 HD domain-containing protein [Oceanibaculum indicum]
MTEPASAELESAEWIARLEADAVIGADARYRLKTHQNAVGDVAEVIARHMGVSEGLCLALGTAAAYHDIGKLQVPAEILCKPGRLTQEEFALMRGHPATGHEMLMQHVGRLAKLAASIALHHHEAMDGSGYPFGLKGEEIPLEARIVGVADVYDALREDRPYRDGMTHDRAMAIILEGDERTPRDKFCPQVKRVVEQHHAEIAWHWRCYH